MMSPALWRRVRWLILGLPLAVAAAILGLRAWSGRADLVRPRRHAELIQRLEVRGQVKARTSTAHFSPIQGEAAKLLELIEGGSLVEPGTVLGRIDDYGLRQKLRALLLETERLEAERQAQQIRLDLGDEQARRRQADLIRRIDQARQAVASYDELEAPLEELARRNALATAEAELAEAELRLADTRELEARGYASSAELAEAERARAAAAGRREEAHQRLELFTGLERRRSLAERRQELARLEDQLADARQGRQAERRIAVADLAALEARLAEQRRQRTELEAQLEGCTLRANSRGIAVRGQVSDQEAGQRPVQVGDLVWSNVVLVRVTDLDRLDLEAAVAEERLHDLALDRPATLWLAAEPLEPLEAAVRAIGGMSRGSLRVDLAITDPPDWVRPGMSGRAEIRLRRFAPALTVPYGSVRFDGGQARVFRRRFGRTRPVAIEVAGLTEAGVVVGAGLSPRDRILRRAQSP